MRAYVPSKVVEVPFDVPSTRTVTPGNGTPPSSTTTPLTSMDCALKHIVVNNNIKKNLIFIDTIYNPLETKTLKILKEKKIKTFNGLNMFLYQGQKSFYLWNKINPEIDQKLIDLLLEKLK